MKRRGGVMSDELFHKIIRDGKEMGSRYFVPFLNGEPFVFPKIWNWLDYMQKEGVATALTTNAEYVDPERLATYKNIMIVYCSINAATKETYEKVMPGPDFDRVIKNVERLMTMDPPFRVRVAMVAVKDNEHEIDAFKSKWGKRTNVQPFKNWTGDKHDPLEKTGKRKPCKLIRRGMTILWDGRVVPCCMDYEGKLILGDVNKNTLQEIWNNSIWLREAHLKRDFSMAPCLTCNHNI